MGTQLEMLLLHPDKAYLRGVINDIEEEVNRLESRLSRFIPTSEVSRINRLAAKKPVLIDPEMVSILKIALKFYDLTDGAFDITVAPLLRKWGFYQKNYQVVDAETLEKLKQSVGSNRVELDETRRTIRFMQKGMEIDLGGMGKGYTVDRIVEILRESDISAALISFGGSSIYGRGKPEGQESWRFSFKVSDHPDFDPVPVALRDHGFSLSAPYYRQFNQDGKSYGHIFDPVAGQPTEGLLAAAVIDESALHAEMLSTAFMVMGWEKTQVFLDQHKNVKAFLALPYLDNYQLYKINIEES